MTHKFSAHLARKAAITVISLALLALGTYLFLSSAARYRPGYHLALANETPYDLTITSKYVTQENLAIKDTVRLSAGEVRTWIAFYRLRNRRDGTYIFEAAAPKVGSVSRSLRASDLTRIEEGHAPITFRATDRGKLSIEFSRGSQLAWRAQASTKRPGVTWSHLAFRAL